jgi:hypothetical protein
MYAQFILDYFLLIIHNYLCHAIFVACLKNLLIPVCNSAVIVTGIKCAPDFQLKPTAIEWKRLVFSS